MFRSSATRNIKVGQDYDLEASKENLEKINAELNRLAETYTSKDVCGLSIISNEIAWLVDRVGNLHALIDLFDSNEYLLEKEELEDIKNEVEKPLCGDEMIKKILDAFNGNDLARAQVSNIIKNLANHYEASQAYLLEKIDSELTQRPSIA